jgi:secreted PhoX family phosphatase
MTFRISPVGLFCICLLIVTGLAVAQETIPVPSLSPDDPYAPFLDTYHFAIDKGASAEWHKLEGVALDADAGKVYFAVSSIHKEMADDSGDLQLRENACGAVFMGQLDGDMNITSVAPVLAGGPHDENNAENICDVNAVAGPDNLAVDREGHLWIGEDSDGHKNNVLWMWDGSTLQRFATLPLGAEVTGVHIAADGTLFLNVQHPDDTNTPPFDRGTIGVITGYTAGEPFNPISIPTSDSEKTTLRIAAGEYQILGRVGDPIPGSTQEETFGNLITHDNLHLSTCNKPDGNMFLPTGDNTGILYTNFECGVGGISQMRLERDASGTWTTSEGQLLDFAPVNGTANNCAASITPWNTGLSAEEYPGDNPDNWLGWINNQRDTLSIWLGKPVNPFDLGYMIELTPTDTGTQIVKHYAMGRFSHEVGVVMPDRRTVYSGDDGSSRVLFKFVADTSGDLSAGTLYAAHITQDGDTLNIEWIELGHGNDADIYTAIRSHDGEYDS